MNKFINDILDLIYPPKCSFCRKVVRADCRGICPDCRSKLPVLPAAECKTVLEEGTECISALKYDEMVRASFLRYKFYGFVSYAEPYAFLLADCMKNRGLEFDLVTWVPLSKKRKKKRGYDQAELLARDLSRLLGLDCRAILYKNKDTKAQSLTKDRAERKTNIKDVYSVFDSVYIRDNRILIVDDIVTTGATLSECCSVLKKAGASSVTAVTFAKAVR